MMKTVKLKRKIVSMCQVSLRNPWVFLRLPEYERLCEEHGTYGFSWYFTDFKNNLKYFTNKNGWNYAHYNWQKYQDWMKKLRKES